MTEKTKSRKKAKPAPSVPAPVKALNLLRVKRERGVVLSMAEVAKLIDCDEATVSRHETGHRSMSRDQILKYAKLYRCETHELFILPDDREDFPEPEEVAGKTANV